jgi:ribulose-5-phosphate 4-epimerase/fuculose-1-phosphate aldolase
MTSSRIVRPQTLAGQLGGPPRFDSPERAREHVKKRLAGGLRALASLGFVEGVAGHAAVRDPELTDHFWTNPFSASARLIRPQQLLLVSPQGDVVEGEGMVNGSAFVMQSCVFAARPDVNAVCHAHSRFGVAWSSLGRVLSPINQDACVFFEAHALYDRYDGLHLTKEMGIRIAGELGDGIALILRNHGLVTVGASVDEAAWWFIAMERACEIELVARAAGDPVEINAVEARLTRSQIGTPMAGWLNFQPIWRELLQHNPDLED